MPRLSDSPGRVRQPRANLPRAVEWDTEEEIEEHLRSERFRRLLPYIEMSVEPPKVDFSTIDQIRGIEYYTLSEGRFMGLPAGSPGQRVSRRPSLLTSQEE
jgi:hypothetical protein